MRTMVCYLIMELELSAGDNGNFVAEVCHDPDRRRRLNGVSFSFHGGRKCRFCNEDNFDARRGRLLDSSSSDDDDCLLSPNTSKN